MTVSLEQKVPRAAVTAKPDAGGDAEPAAETCSTCRFFAARLVFNAGTPMGKCRGDSRRP